MTEQRPGFEAPRFEGDTRPDFAAGNSLAQQHGAWATGKVQPIADQFHASLVETAPWCAAPAFTGTVQSWAWAEGQAQLLRAYVDERGHFDDEGEERSAVRSLDRIEARLARLRDQLGLNPSALSKLLQTAAITASVTGTEGSFTALQSEGRRILEARAIDAGTTDDDGDDE